MSKRVRLDSSFTNVRDTPIDVWMVIFETLPTFMDRWAFALAFYKVLPEIHFDVLLAKHLKKLLDDSGIIEPAFWDVCADYDYVISGSVLLCVIKWDQHGRPNPRLMTFQPSDIDIFMTEDAMYSWADDLNFSGRTPGLHCPMEIETDVSILMNNIKAQQLYEHKKLASFRFKQKYELSTVPINIIAVQDPTLVYNRYLLGTQEYGSERLYAHIDQRLKKKNGIRPMNPRFLHAIEDYETHPLGSHHLTTPCFARTSQRRYYRMKESIKTFDLDFLKMGFFQYREHLKEHRSVDSRILPSCQCTSPSSPPHAPQVWLPKRTFDSIHNNVSTWRLKDNGCDVLINKKFHDSNMERQLALERTAMRCFKRIAKYTSRGFKIEITY